MSTVTYAKLGYRYQSHATPRTPYLHCRYCGTCEGPCGCPECSRLLARKNRSDFDRAESDTTIRDLLGMIVR